MAWVENHAGRYRVRSRRTGHIVTDSTYANFQDAAEQASRLNAATRDARRRYMPLPAPRLDDWVAAWMPAHLAAASTMARYESLLRIHILPVFGSRRIDTITRQDVKAFARALSTNLADSSVRHIVTLLGLLLREAIDEHLMIFDPTARLRLRDHSREPRPFRHHPAGAADRRPDARADYPHAGDHRRLHRHAHQRTERSHPGQPSSRAGSHPRLRHLRSTARGSRPPEPRPAEDARSRPRHRPAAVPRRRPRTTPADPSLRHRLLQSSRRMAVAHQLHLPALATRLRRTPGQRLVADSARPALSRPTPHPPHLVGRRQHPRSSPGPPPRPRHPRHPRRLRPHHTSHDRLPTRPPPTTMARQRLPLVNTPHGRSRYRQDVKGPGRLCVCTWLRLLDGICGIVPILMRTRIGRPAFLVRQ